MEDPRYSALGDDQVNALNLSFDPTLTTFQFPQSTGLTPLPQSMTQNYNMYSADAFSHSYIQNMPSFNPNVNFFDGMPPSSHDELNSFFNDVSFGGNTPGVGTPGAGSRVMGEQPQETIGASWLKHVQQHTPVDDTQNNASLAIDTSSQIVEQHNTLVKNGQITPGNSPSSPKSRKASSVTTKKTRKTKASANAEPTVVPAPSTDGADAAAPAPAKRTRKPRKSSKKVPTPEQEAQKRETFLKRNREAAYKCRIKKKNQTEQVVERAKMLDQDNALKGLQVEQLRREVEGLRALLLPHWRTCQDEALSTYVDKLVNEGWGLGKVVIGAMAPRPEFDAGEEPREDDGMNDEPTQFAENTEQTQFVSSAAQTQYEGSPKSTHPRNEDDDESREPAHKRHRSGAIFELSVNDFEASMSSMDDNRQRRESFFGSSIGPGKTFDARSSLSSSASATPMVRSMDALQKEFLNGETPPPMNLSAPDGDGLVSNWMSV